jgi:hypothetical protein
MDQRERFALEIPRVSAAGISERLPISLASYGIINRAFDRHALLRRFGFEHPGCSGAAYGLLLFLAA